MINPIASVDGREIPCPSSYLYKIQDFSAGDAGRTEDGLMHKKRLGQVVGLELEWRNISTEAVSKILTAFDPEYVTVRYLDAKTGDFRSDEFYVGDRSAPLYNARMSVWSNLTFHLIRR